MCSKAKYAGAGVYFNPDTKCCTYYPNLPNYAVGGILQDERKEAAVGRSRVLEKITGRQGVYPVGLLRPRKYDHLYSHGMQGFGKSLSMRCPYYAETSGSCSIWHYREAVCSSWFCKFDDGYVGQLYWEGVRDYLKHLQRLLACFVLDQLNWPPESIHTYRFIDWYTPDNSPGSRHQLDENDLDEKAMPDTAYKAAWREWYGREKEFYETAYAMVQKLDRETVEHLGGFDLRIHEQRIARLRDSIAAPELPKALIRNPGIVLKRQPNGRYLLSSYSAFDPISLSKEVYELLYEFDGLKTVEQTVADIRETRQLTLSEELICALFKQQVLISPGEIEQQDKGRQALPSPN